MDVIDAFAYSANPSYVIKWRESFVLGYSRRRDGGVIVRRIGFYAF